MTQSNTAREQELQNLLTDEKERCNQHKQLYQTLKEDHVKLKDELALVYQQLREAVSKNEQLQTSKDGYIKRLEEQLREKQKIVQQLSEEVKSFDPKKIRDSVVEEATSHYETKIKELHSETDKTREQYNNLHYEYAVLKCQFESKESEYSHALERLKLRHLEEIEELRNKIETFEKDKSFPDDSNAIDLKSARHEVLQLNSKYKGLLAECEELRAQNENLTLQLNSTNRTYLKQTADNISNIRSLESEKQKAVMQKEVLEKELSNFHEQRRIMNSDLQTSKREILSLTNRLEEYEHRCRMMTTNAQVENEHLKAEHESERDQLIDEITKLKTALRDTAMELNRIQQVSMAKEQELQQNILAARQQIWKKSSDFEQEKEELERRFQNFRNHKDQIISELSHEVQVLQQNLKVCTESKLELEKEFVSLRERLEGTSKNIDATAVEALSRQNIQYENEIKALKEQINLLRTTSNTFIEEKDRLLHDFYSRQKVDHNYDEEREILQLKLNWEQQKHQFHQRLEDLESQLKDTKNSSAAEKKELEGKIQQYSRIVNKLKEKLDFHKVKNEELENQREILEKNIPYEVHQRVISKLTELQRRLEEYRLIVAAEPHFALCSRSAAPMPDKLLTDIKNLQLRFPPLGDTLYEPSHLRKEKTDRTASQPKKYIYTRRRSLKTRNKEQTSKASPVISSSSDLDLENL